MSGWIKLHRKLTEWEWYSDVNTTRVFLHLLLIANHKDNKWRGTDIKRGQKLTSISKLSKEVNLSERKVRTAIKHLKSTNDVTSNSNAQHTVFTVVNYDSYQEVTNEVTNKRQTSDKQVTTNKNEKNEKNDNNKDIAFDFFWLNMRLKKAAKPKALLAFNKHATKETDPMVFAKMLVDDTRDRSRLNQFGFDRLNPTTYLNGCRWEDDKPVNNSEKFKYVLDSFNDAMSGAKVPFAESMTESRVNLINHLFATTSLKPDTVHKLFNHIAISDAFKWERGETTGEAKDLSYFLTEQSYNKAREQ